MPEISIHGEAGDIEVWLDAGIAPCDGIVVGLGADRLEALTDAIDELEQRLDELRRLRDAEKEKEAAREPIMSIVAHALDNAIRNGCAQQLSRMSDTDIAYDLARLDALCERLPIEDLIAGVFKWRTNRPALGHVLPMRRRER